MGIFRSYVAVGLGVVLAFACSTSGPASPTSSCGSTPKADGDYPCDVGTVIQNRCQECHQNPPQHGAHFSLLTFEDTQQPYSPGKLRWQRMAEVIEPDTIPHMPYQDAGQLNPDELKTLRDWFETCAPPVPEGQGCDKGE